jgi:hypothetical protein
LEDCDIREKFWSQDLKEPLGKARVDEMKNLKVVLKEIGCKPADSIQFEQDRAQWRSFVDTTKNLQFSLNF